MGLIHDTQTGGIPGLRHSASRCWDNVIIIVKWSPYSRLDFHWPATHSPLYSRLVPRQWGLDVPWPFPHEPYMATFEETILLPIPRAVLFDFLAQPANVAKISDSALALKFTSAPEVIAVGSRILIQMVVMGQIQKATHEITVCTRPERIVEVQIEGPMKSWRHEHTFEEAGDQTRMIDRIEYTKPGGIVGLLLTEAKINDMLEENFFQREQNLRRLIAQGPLK